MKKCMFSRWIFFLTGTIQAVGILSAQKSGVVDDNALRNAASTSNEWQTYGRDYAETHYSPLNQIDTSNVKRLGLAWSWETESPSGGRLEGTPLFSNGILYGSLAWDVLFAVDAYWKDEMALGPGNPAPAHL
jgi:quinohemoprotein ethanol dehydrogenase